MGRRVGALEEARSDERAVRGDDSAWEEGPRTPHSAGIDADRAAQLVDALHDVLDPEIPISIVDMGLVVDLQFAQGRVEIEITFTAMGCPAMDMILDDVRERLLREPDVDEVRMEIVWDPIWTKERLSEEGRMLMREWGISV